MDALGALFSSTQSAFKAKSGSIMNIFICLTTAGSQKFFSVAAFNCPCPNNVTDSSGLHPNYIYGWVFIVVPAFALFVLGYAMNQKTWKMTTGCCRRSYRAARGYCAGCATLTEITVQAFVAPMAWASFAFLNGIYYACAVSKHPYAGPCDVVRTQDKPTYSGEFEENVKTSQIIGWLLIAFVLVGGSLLYMINRCLSPLTYYHRKYAIWYRDMEVDAFEKIAKTQIKEEVEKETVKRFLQRKRNKHSWDKIATVFTFIRDLKNFALYSRIDEWNELHKEELLLGDGEHLMNESDSVTAGDDTSSESRLLI